MNNPEMITIQHDNFVTLVQAAYALQTLHMKFCVHSEAYAPYEDNMITRKQVESVFNALGIPSLVRRVVGYNEQGKREKRQVELLDKYHKLLQWVLYRVESGDGIVVQEFEKEVDTLRKEVEDGYDY